MDDDHFITYGDEDEQQGQASKFCTIFATFSPVLHCSCATVDLQAQLGQAGKGISRLPVGRNYAGLFEQLSRGRGDGDAVGVSLCRVMLVALDTMACTRPCRQQRMLH